MSAFPRVTSLLLATILAASCALEPTEPGLPVQLPVSLDPGGRAVAVVGDLQVTPAAIRWILHRENNAAPQAKLLADMQGRLAGIGALVIVGDLVFSGGSGSDWEHFDAAIAPFAARVPLLPAIGNHDYRCVLVKICSQRVVPKNFRNRFPWFRPGQAYYVQYGDLGLVFVDSETGLEAQGQWLRALLPELVSNVRAIAVFTHRPPYTDADRADVEPDVEVQENIVAALSQSSLTWVFFSGHAHGYEHLVVDGRHFVVSAGGGGPRGKLFPRRPNDVYAGRDCTMDSKGEVLRPYNYALMRLTERALEITVYGFCRSDTEVGELERILIPVGK